MSSYDDEWYYRDSLNRARDEEYKENNNQTAFESGFETIFGSGSDDQDIFDIDDIDDNEDADGLRPHTAAAFESVPDKRITKITGVLMVIGIPLLLILAVVVILRFTHNVNNYDIQSNEIADTEEIEFDQVYKDKTKRKKTSAWFLEGGITQGKRYTSYHFAVNEEGILTATFSLLRSVEVDIYDANSGNQMSHNVFEHEAGSRYVYLPAGSYYLGVSNASPIGIDIGKRKFEFSLHWDPYKETNEKENNDSFDDAAHIELNKFYKGALQTEDDIDCFKFKLDNVSTVTFAFLTTYLQDTYVEFNGYLYNEQGQKVKDFSFKMNGADSHEIEDLAAGEYYIKIQPQKNVAHNYNDYLTAVIINEE